MIRYLEHLKEELLGWQQHMHREVSRIQVRFPIHCANLVKGCTYGKGTADRNVARHGGRVAVLQSLRSRTAQQSGQG